MTNIYTEEDFQIFDEILDCAKFILSRLKPSEWAELNRMMTSDISPIPGMLSYKNSPYTREIVDCFSPDHPMRIMAIMKGAQIGFSTSVIESAIGWIISQNPGNILFLIGHDDLVDESIAKVDRMVDNSGLRSLIKSNTMRTKNMKTGDTNRKKEFPGGSLIGGIANHKTLRNRSVQYGFIDDFEAMKAKTKEAGNMTDMIEQRFAAYRQKMKLCYISTPELEATSNIKPVYLLGDQRKYFIPCPCCGEFIDLHWSVKSLRNPNKNAGIHWEIDEEGALVRGSVGYVCQACDDKFDDKNKNQLLLSGMWKPTAKASRDGYYSYHISSLYAPTYMFDWEDYVYKFLEANPKGQPRIEEKYQTFVNLVLGETYSPPGTSIKSSDLQVNNVRKYSIGIIPEKQSIADGNGKIVLITCAADLGGLVTGINSDHDDVRLDWEVCAWTESGTSYSIDQGSIGTFTPAHMGKRDEARELWSYDMSKPNNVWKEFTKIMSKFYDVDGTGRKMGVNITGIDTGFAEHHAFNFIDRSNLTVIGLKGDKEHKYIPFGDNSPNWKEGSSRSKLYILKVGKLKDQLAQRISLRWDKYSKDPQPGGYLNFPQPSGEKYSLENYFLHFESEERKLDKANNFIWQKKTHTAQNHFWDVHNYQMALKDIMMENVFKELKIKNGTWPEFCDWVLKNRPA